MAKRRTRNKKNNTSPNIPDSVMERARQQIGADDNDTEDAITETESDLAVISAEAQREAEKRSERAVKRASRRRQTASVSDKKKRNEVSPELVADMLANPTINVTEDQLRNQYGYVIADLRNMGVLAAILFMVLLALGFLQTL